MILVDTGPLVALIDPRDGLHERSRRDLSHLRVAALSVTVPVLTETFHLLPGGLLRRKLRAILDALGATIREAAREEVFAAWDWMDLYAEHEPEFADAVTVVLASSVDGCRVWTYDREFRTTWRDLNGSAIPLLPEA